MRDEPKVESLNVGSVRTIDWRGERLTTGIWKFPVDGRRRVAGVNILGDDQADRSVHGGPDKAVYAYASEDYDYWRSVEGLQDEPALFGENLTTRGIDLSSARPGDRWAVGTAVFEVVQPRLPCYKLGIRVGDPRFVKRFLAANRPGAYLRIVEEGEIGRGDVIRVLSRPAHTVTMRTMVLAIRDESQARLLRDVTYLPGFWRRLSDRGAEPQIR
jgi:MOSC domain-containing protein YiiM